MLRYCLHFQVSGSLDDLATFFTISIKFNLTAVILLLSFLFANICRRIHPGHVVLAETERLVRIRVRVLIGAEEGLADDLVHFLVLGWRLGEAVC